MIKDKTLLIYVQDYKAGDSLSLSSSEELNMPLGILYLGSYLESHGYKSRLLDTRLYKKDDFFKRLRNELRDCILVGFSALTPCINNALEITKFVKNTDPLIKTVWGGIHATLFPESTIFGKYIDFVIVKEGEKGLLSLVEYLMGKAIKIFNIPNLVFVEKNNILKNRIEMEMDLEAIGVPNYELLEMDRYIDRLIQPGYRKRQAEILSSRGCPCQCTFCVNPIVFQNHYRSEPLKQTVKNLDYLVEKYNIEHIFFMDEDFFCDRKRIKNLIDKITHRNITWESNCRANYINNGYINDDFLVSLKKSGCIKLRFGLESGSQRILDLLKKGITIRQSMNAVQKLTNHKILPSASFMMGLPEETVNDIIKTMDLIFKLFTINPRVDILGPLIFRPYPGSELFKKCQVKGLVVPKRLDEWSDFFIHNTLDEYTKGLIWFPDVYIFKHVWLFVGYLRFSLKINLLKYLIWCILKFHLITKLRFICIDYSIYRISKNLVMRFKG